MNILERLQKYYRRFVEMKHGKKKGIDTDSLYAIEKFFQNKDFNTLNNKGAICQYSTRREFLEQIFSSEGFNEEEKNFLSQNKEDILQLFTDIEKANLDDKVLIRIELHSIHDNNISDYKYEGFLKQVLDICNINPSLFAGELQLDDFPDIPERNGNEFVDVDDMVRECKYNKGNSTLVFLGSLDLRDLYLLPQNISEEEYFKITLPGGNYCGFFDKEYGTGSILNCRLKKDISLLLYKEFHGNFFRLEVEEGDFYFSIISSFEVDITLFGEKVKVELV